MGNLLGILPCCAPISRTALSAADAERLASALRAVSEPARLRLLSLIQTQPGGEACVCHLTEALGISQPTVSHHLKVLEEAGFLAHERRGRWIYYRVVPEALSAVQDLFAPATKTFAET